MESQCPTCANPVRRLGNISDEYEIDQQNLIGKGAYGSVYRAIRRSDAETVVVKTSRSRDDDIEDGGIGHDFIREVSALKALYGHPNIIRILDFHYARGVGSIVLELGDRSLDEILKLRGGSYGLNSNLSRITIRSIITGVEFMNSHGIMHRDIKSANILLVGDSIKIADFGLARGGPFQLISKTDIVYTLWYRPPENLIQEVLSEYPIFYDWPAEVWSVGIVFWELLTAPLKNFRGSISDLRGADIFAQLGVFIQAFGANLFDFGYGSCTGQACRESLEGLYELDYQRPDIMTSRSEYSIPQTLERASISRDSEEAGLLLRLLDPNPRTRIQLVEALNTSRYLRVMKERPPSISQTSITKDTPCTQEDMPRRRNQVTQRDWSWLSSELWRYFKKDYEGVAIPPAVYFLATHILHCHFIAAEPQGNYLTHAAAALYLASKYQSKYPEPISRIARSFGLSRSAISETAIAMLSNVGGQLHLPTSFAFLVEHAIEKGLEIRKISYGPGDMVEALAKLEMQEFPHKMSAEEYALRIVAERIWDQN